MVHNRVLYVLILAVIWCLQSLIAESNFIGNSRAPTAPWNATTTDRLKRKLLLHYDKFVRPAYHGKTTNVSVGLRVTHVEINEFKNTFTVHGSLAMAWKDDKLKWNKNEYDGLDLLHIADHEIWQPDVVPYNSAAGSTIDHYSNTYCVVFPEGQVLWVPSMVFVVFCEPDLRLWPFDEQKCLVKLGSWTTHGYQINLTIAEKNHYSADYLLENSEWHITNVTSERHEVIYTCCPQEPYYDVTFNFVIRRKSATYKTIVVIPTFAVIAMTLLSFWLPSSAGEKLFLNCCTATVICLFLLFFSQKCPAMADHIPLILLFYSSSLYVISFSLIGSVIVIWITRTHHHRSLPWVIKNILTGKLGKYLGLPNHISKTSVAFTTTSASIVSSNDLQTQRQNYDGTDDGRVSSIQHDWFLLAVAVDRLSFVFYSILFVIFALAFSL